MVEPRENLIGQKFNKLTVVRQGDDYINPKSVHYARWECDCDCGNKGVLVAGYRLKSGETKSCGCLSAEKSRERRKRNRFDIVDDYCIGYANKENIVFYFDISDLEAVQEYTWWPDRKKDGNVYMRATVMNDGKKSQIYLHRFLTGNNLTDHIDRNTLNNRRSNLRIANPTENNRNSSLAKNNTSGVTGVVWIKNYKKWYANIMIDYQNINLGYFDNKEDAIIARLKAEKEYFKEFAPQRHLYEQYGIVD